VQHNKLSGSLDTDVTKVRGLKYLFLGDNDFSGPLPALNGLDELVTLRLENNRFSGSIPPSLGELPKLQVLRVDHNRLSGDVPAALAQATSKLGECDLSNNKLACPACNARCGLQGKAK
jgi:Leucine-rich repeat (LRR) protein